jgi:hypothetical protein
MLARVLLLQYDVFAPSRHGSKRLTGEIRMAQS